ncbi:ABC transporter ATP-binding protein [Spiroplasma syrphidicola EA-1]|uniref:ABC transporter ATP-binding protein n=1 Tax=Spiroplasma syrphidicola EA-1 TaxID=1276229 RepID=R4U495_9MOLU|nr:ABC transporter ATP-binding protein [Spiroplasma syrphidicola EA-1]
MHKKVKDLVIIKDLSLDIMKGEKIAILGANGSGKTTLIEIIAGITKPSSGTAKVHTQGSKMKRLGLQFQEGYWPKGVTPKIIINYYTNKKDRNSAWLKKLIEIFEVEPYLKKDLNNLSGGEKQRFNAMLAVINQPEIIILDELITGLDLKMQMKLIAFFKTYLKEHPDKTLILVSHHPEEVEEVCERIILLEKGTLIVDAPLTEIKQKYGSVRNFMEQYYQEMGVVV